MKIDMKGLEELQKRLNTLASAEKEVVENKALTEAASYLSDKIQDRVPVGKTGKLQLSIAEGEVIDGKVQIGPSQQGPAYRAHFIEFGTKYQSAQPFIRPAFEVSKSQLIKIMGNELRKGLKL